MSALMLGGIEECMALAFRRLGPGCRGGGTKIPKSTTP